MGMKKQAARKKKPVKKTTKKFTHLPQIGSLDDSRHEPITSDPIGGMVVRKK